MRATRARRAQREIASALRRAGTRRPPPAPPLAVHSSLCLRGACTTRVQTGGPFDGVLSTADPASWARVYLDPDRVAPHTLRAIADDVDVTGVAAHEDRIAVGILDRVFRDVHVTDFLI